MLVTSKLHVIFPRIAFVGAICFGLQLLTGTPLYIALLWTIAVISGISSIFAAGGFSSAVGVLNAILVTKYLLFALLIKTLTIQPVDLNLRAPVTTVTVMCLGFTGLLVGTFIQCRFPKPSLPLIPSVKDERFYLAFTIVLLMAGYGGYFVGLGPSLTGGGLQTGGILGIARALGGLKAFAVVAALYFAWARGGPRFLTHPLVIGILLVGTLVGIFSTGKEDAMEPFVFYVVVGFVRYGLRDKRMWALAITGVLYYAIVIYPYSQYVRSHGGREGDLSARIQVVKDTFWMMLSDSNFRRSANATTASQGNTYLNNPTLDPFDRFAMIGEADRLIYATEAQQAFTGWETITWGFRLMLPSFIYPNKPIFGASNYLAHIAGDVGTQDDSTQVAYGVMANLYNALGFPGVFLGSIVFYAVFYYVFRFWFGDPRLSASPFGNAMWFLLIVDTLQHSLAEGSISDLLTAFQFPFVVFVLYRIAKFGSSFLPRDVQIHPGVGLLRHAAPDSQMRVVTVHHR